jgi:hypothetical protein
MLIIANSYEQSSFKKEKEMLTLVLLIFALLVAIDLAVLRWGFDSSDGINSPEWERRQRWYGYH